MFPPIREWWWRVIVGLANYLEQIAAHRCSAVGDRGKILENNLLTHTGAARRWAGRVCTSS